MLDSNKRLFPIYHFSLLYLLILLTVMELRDIRVDRVFLKEMGQRLKVSNVLVSCIDVHAVYYVTAAMKIRNKVGCSSHLYLSVTVLEHKKEAECCFFSIFFVMDYLIYVME